MGIDWKGKPEDWSGPNIGLIMKIGLMGYINIQIDVNITTEKYSVLFSNLIY